MNGISSFRFCDNLGTSENITQASGQQEENLYESKKIHRDEITASPSVNLLNKVLQEEKFAVKFSK